jgi:hypothetical protein
MQTFLQWVMHAPILNIDYRVASTRLSLDLR